MASPLKAGRPVEKQDLKDGRYGDRTCDNLLVRENDFPRLSLTTWQSMRHRLPRKDLQYHYSDIVFVRYIEALMDPNWTSSHQIVIFNYACKNKKNNGILF